MALLALGLEMDRSSPCTKGSWELQNGQTSCKEVIACESSPRLPFLLRSSIDSSALDQHPYLAFGEPNNNPLDVSVSPSGILHPTYQLIIRSKQRADGEEVPTTHPPTLVSLLAASGLML